MRILVLADIHANWPALQALKESFDACLCLGDYVDYGLEPSPCIDWVRKNATSAIRGNHDHGAAHNVVVTGQTGFKYLTSVTRPVTRQLLQPGELRWLANLPVTSCVTLDNQRYLLVHATPRDPLDEYGPAETDFWERRLEGVDADVICVGHTHVPYTLTANGKQVINPGSLGLPRDGDPRAACAIIENRNVTLKRFDYPIEDTVRVVQESSLPDDAKTLLIEVYRTGEARSAKGRTTVKSSPANKEGDS
jgi:predicted phosphodiesterase